MMAGSGEKGRRETVVDGMMPGEGMKREVETGRGLKGYEEW